MMKYLFLLLLASSAAAQVGECSGADHQTVTNELQRLSTPLTPQAVQCLGFMQNTVLPSLDQGSLSAVLQIKDQFCTAGSSCSQLIGALIEAHDDLVARFPACEAAFKAPVKEYLNSLGLQLEEPFEAVKEVRRKVCALECGGDIACWVCSSAEYAANLDEDLDVCAELPFCEKNDADVCGIKAANNATCPGQSMLTIFRRAIQGVRDACGDTLSDSAAQCSEACRPAARRLFGLAIAVKDERLSEFLGCLLNQGGTIEILRQVANVFPLFGRADPAPPCGLSQLEVEESAALALVAIEEAIAADAIGDGSTGPIEPIVPSSATTAAASMAALASLAIVF